MPFGRLDVQQPLADDVGREDEGAQARGEGVRQVALAAAGDAGGDDQDAGRGLSGVGVGEGKVAAGRLGGLSLLRFRHLRLV